MKKKVTRKITEEVEIAVVEIDIPLDEITEHDPQLPDHLLAMFRARDRRHNVTEVWRLRVNADNGQIENWPEPIAIDLYCKPRDGGTYRLFSPNGNQVAAIEQNYVPNRCIPGEYGDYIDLKIDATGKITNWPRDPDVAQFFGEDKDS